jgi:hypothetical protein
MQGNAVHPFSLADQGCISIGQIMRDQLDGHVTSKFDFSAPDDEVAQERALEAASGQDLELWRNDRKISEWRGPRPTWHKIRRVSNGG